MVGTFSLAGELGLDAVWVGDVEKGAGWDEEEEAEEEEAGAGAV